MGHYDDCYASDDYAKIEKAEREEAFVKFDYIFERDGSVWGTFDDVRGHLLLEWAQNRHHKIRRGYKDLTVVSDSDLLDVVTRVVSERDDELKRRLSCD